MAFLAALTPDLDVFWLPMMRELGRPAGVFEEFLIHRGASHSLLAVPLIALPITGIWWSLRRAFASKDKCRSFGLLYACIFVAVLTHPLLDACTSYGTQLLWPFNRTRYALDAIAIVDLIYTPLLILTLLLCAIAWRLPSWKREAGMIGWIGFILATVYILTGYGLGRYAGHLAGQGPSGRSPNAVCRAHPYLGTIFVWRVTVHDGPCWQTTRVNVLRSKPADLSFEQACDDDNEWVERAAALEPVEVFCWFAGGRVRPVYYQRDGRHVVEFHDMRYGARPESAESLWFAQVEFSPTGGSPEIYMRMNREMRRLNWPERFSQLLNYLRSP